MAHTKDTICHDYMQRPHVFADAFNYLLYGGRHILDSSRLTPSDTRETMMLGDRLEHFVSINRQRDLIRSAVAKTCGESHYVLLGIENQSSEDVTMPLRCLLYDVLALFGEFQRCGESHRGASEHPGSDSLSYVRRNDRVQPVVTLVIYWSANEWRAPTTLQELMDFPEPELREFTPDYRMKLIQPCQMEVKDFEKFSSSLGKMLHYAKCLNDSDRMLELLRKDPYYSHAGKEASKLMMALGGAAPDKYTDYKEEGGYNMCKAWDDLKFKSEAIGEARGVAIGEARGVAIGEARGVAIGEARGEEKGTRIGALKMGKATMAKLRSYGLADAHIQQVLESGGLSCADAEALLAGAL